MNRAIVTPVPATQLPPSFPMRQIVRTTAFIAMFMPVICLAQAESASESGADHTGTCAQLELLQRQYEQAERDAEKLADELRDKRGQVPLGSHMESLRAKVARAFELRIELQQARLAKAESDLQAARTNLAARQRIADKIIERRVRELASGEDTTWLGNTSRGVQSQQSERFPPAEAGKQQREPKLTFSDGERDAANKLELQMELELAERDARSSQGVLEWNQAYFDYIVKQHQAGKADREQVTRANAIRDKSQARWKRHQAIYAKLRDGVNENRAESSSNDKTMSDGKEDAANTVDWQMELELAELDIGFSKAGLERQQAFFDRIEKEHQAGKAPREQLTIVKAVRDKARMALKRHQAIYAKLRDEVAENRAESSSRDNQRTPASVEGDQ